MDSLSLYSMSALRRALRWLARFRPAAWALRLGFCYMNFALPLQRLCETPTLLAFYHPRPSYPVHILIVPRQPYPSLLDIPAGGCDFQRELFETVQLLVRRLDLENAGYRLIVNGGAYQEFPILHFHLISEDA